VNAGMILAAFTRYSVILVANARKASRTLRGRPISLLLDIGIDQMRSALFKFVILAMIVVLSPTAIGFFHSFGCIDRITDENVLQAAKSAYLERLIQTKKADIGDKHTSASRSLTVSPSSWMCQPDANSAFLPEHLSDRCVVLAHLAQNGCDGCV